MNTLARSRRARCTSPAPTSAAATPPPISQARRLKPDWLAVLLTTGAFTWAIPSRQEPTAPVYAANDRAQPREKPLLPTTHRPAEDLGRVHAIRVAPSRATAASSPD